MKTRTPIATSLRPSSADDARWAAVLARDAASDGRFVFAVRTTGIYCRPSCPARRPNRANVVFPASVQDAEQQGFRPCKRCRPRGRSQSTHDVEIVATACRTLEQADRAPALAQLARAAGVSPSHFQRLFKKVTGLTPGRFAAGVRAHRFERALARGGRVTDAIYAAGFASSGRAYATATARLGMTPSRFRSGGADTSIRFALGRCSLGRILVAATEKGLCAILLGDDADALTADLRARFPKARIEAAEPRFERDLARVVDLVDDPRRGLDLLPLDVRGSAFEKRVWEALRAIPPGGTASYRDVARSIGRPDAARAVASACARNPLAIAVPCHRVVRSDGSQGGYRWGSERKKRILEREALARPERFDREERPSRPVPPKRARRKSR